ncbi:MAG: UTRA domain-containing protein, partial [Pseudonocardia sp.]|nr:UTRA domain-containing protein [Pseudonocardia sp.]
FSHSGLYDELAGLTGTRLTGGSEVITAAVPTAETRKLLKIPPGTAVMEVARIGCLRDQPVEWRTTQVRGDRFAVAAQWSAQEGYRMDVSGAATAKPARSVRGTR